MTDLQITLCDEKVPFSKKKYSCSGADLIGTDATLSYSYVNAYVTARAAHWRAVSAAEQGESQRAGAAIETRDSMASLRHGREQLSIPYVPSIFYM
jgi:hypothetical protein